MLNPIKKVDFYEKKMFFEHFLAQFWLTQNSIHPSILLHLSLSSDWVLLPHGPVVLHRKLQDTWKLCHWPTLSCSCQHMAAKTTCEAKELPFYSIFTFVASKIPPNTQLYNYFTYWTNFNGF